LSRYTLNIGPISTGDHSFDVSRYSEPEYPHIASIKRYMTE